MIRYLSTDDKSLLVYEALASRPRLDILDWLAKRPMSVKEIAEALSFSSATVTVHVQKLEEAGLIVCSPAPGKHGRQKLCRLAADSFQGSIRTRSGSGYRDDLSCSIRVGHYTDYSVKPTCGLAMASSFIGQLDDPRYFSDTRRFDADVLWFAEGFVEYRIPNYLLPGQRLARIDISMELCSEAPGSNEIWPSDISFELGGAPLGVWTCPGDFGDKRGVLNPDWWPSRNKTQYGLLKIVSVTEEGTFIDGVKLSDTSARDVQPAFGQHLPLRISVLPDAGNVGGVTLFGRGFGNYDQNIEIAFQVAPV
ncbi:ArsR/SmtB family transcription factor [Paenibacillus arenilitoris]|uniref:Helix-turn-helix domain-containing protein n=1 Tax=Paenibacillus arenilitoris TaxID=2772299 RepID=A0A927CKH7_9BACL|nr:helix-turn-helix domain-containing protein [Paenibacillus arenilitoris]MBD2867340.1 helix-turn-helix domain-containing protein [Paenibacillus arenilitoris]